MASGDDLWPPWSPAAMFGGGPRGGGPRDGGPRDGAPPRGRARPGATLSRAEIVDAAIAVADAEGPDAVSMRRIAQVLRAGTMSLYWHVAGKEHLLDLMLDALVGEFEVPVPSGSWRADLRSYALSQRSSLLRHRWVTDYIGGRPAIGPNTIRAAEGAMALLDQLNLDIATAMNVVQSVNTYVLGAVLREFQERQTQRDQESSVHPAEQRAAFQEWQDRLRSAGGFGHFLKIFDQEIDPDSPATRDQRFEFGLDCLLAGIEATVRPA
jgi:AcrR family transcriptional regulator